MAINGKEQARLSKRERIRFQPVWFRAALAQSGDSFFIDIDGKRLHCLSWNAQATDKPGIVLLHGNGAHARWFDFIAPLLLPWYRVFTLDLPGMGDSDWLTRYDRVIFADIMARAIEVAGFAPPLALVAHSFGSLLGLIMANRHPQLVQGLLMCDFLIRKPGELFEWFAERKNTPPTRIYPDKDTAIARFRLMPPQPCANEFILHYIASHSLRALKRGTKVQRDSRPKQDGWTWKFDPNMFDGFRLGDDLHTIYKGLACARAILFGQHSADSERAAVDYMRTLDTRVPYYEIPDAGHHLLLDRPHAFASAILAQMASWQAQGVFKPAGS